MFHRNNNNYNNNHKKNHKKNHNYKKNNNNNNNLENKNLENKNNNNNYLEKKQVYNEIHNKKLRLKIRKMQFTDEKLYDIWIEPWYSFLEQTNYALAIRAPTWITPGFPIFYARIQCRRSTE